MDLDIKCITPVRPNDVGDTRFELRVVLRLADDEETIDVTAEQLTDYQQFQRIALAKTGCLLDLQLTECTNEFDAYARWQDTLLNAHWQREPVQQFGPASETSPDDPGEPLYRMMDED